MVYLLTQQQGFIFARCLSHLSENQVGILDLLLISQ